MFSADTVRRLGPTKDADCGCGGDCGPCSANFGSGLIEAASGTRPSAADVEGAGGMRYSPGPVGEGILSGRRPRQPIAWWFVDEDDVGVREPCVDVGGPHLRPPEWKDLHTDVRACISLEYDGWALPETDCCELSVQPWHPAIGTGRPELKRPIDCPEMTVEQGLRTEARSLHSDNRHVAEAGGKNPTTPTTEMRALVGAGIHVLLENLDIVQWLWCRIRAWTPFEVLRYSAEDGEWLNVALEERYYTRNFGYINGVPLVSFVDWYWACLEGLLRLRGGSLGWHLTWVDKPESGSNPNATAWAFSYAGGRVLADGSVGVIWPTEHPNWLGRADAFARGGVEAMCAASQVPSTLLHELVHVCAGGYGGKHKDFQFDDELYAQTCWDEPRMAATMFRWAIAQRYPCILEDPTCARYPEDQFFARSQGAAPQLFGGSGG